MQETSEVRHETDGKKGAFFIEKGGKRLAEMVYVMAGAGKFIIEHTEVSDELRGTGAGKKLVEAAVIMAREKQMKIIPLCPFANATFKKEPAWRDVLS